MTEKATDDVARRDNGGSLTDDPPQPSTGDMSTALRGAVEAAFRAGYHTTWDQDEMRYYFDPAFHPGDPDGAFAAWMLSLQGREVLPTVGSEAPPLPPQQETFHTKCPAHGVLDCAKCFPSRVEPLMARIDGQDLPQSDNRATTPMTRGRNAMGDGDEIVWYGPFACDVCGVTIVKAANKQGGAELEAPERLMRVFHRGSEAGDVQVVYPMTWKSHVHDMNYRNSIPAAAPTLNRHA